MGLFDGAADGAGIFGRRGATADLAAHFDLPVVLVVRCCAAGAIGGGSGARLRLHDPAVRIVGISLIALPANGTARW